MFDLFRSQKKMVKWFLSVLLGLVAVSMVITMIPNLFSTPQVNPNETVLAEVGDQVVTSSELFLRLRDYSSMPAETQAFMAEQLVDELLANKVLLAEADRLGIRPSEEELALWLRDQMPFLWTDGKFDSAQYQALVTQRYRVSVPMFEAQVLEDLTIELRLRRMVTDNIIVTEDEVKKAYQDRNRMTKVQYALVSVDDFESKVEAGDEQLASYFEANKLRYQIPEMRSVKVGVLDASTMIPPAITDAQIRNFYDQNRYRFETQERVRASHILFMTQDPNTGEDYSEEKLKEVEAKANEVLAKAKTADDAAFAELAKESSEDPGSASRGGDLDWVVRGQMVPEFENATFGLQPGQTSELIKTSFGYHVIRAHEKEAAQMRPLEDVRDEIIADLRAEQAVSYRLQKVDQALQALRGAADADQAAAQVGLQLQPYAEFARNSPPPDLARMQPLVTNIFTSAVGDAFSHEQGEATWIAVVTGITPSREAALDEVRDRVRSDYVAAEARKLAEARAGELVAKAQEGGLAAAAKSFGLSVETSEFVKRSDSIAGFAGVSALGPAAFTAEPGAIEGPIAAGARFGVYSVVEKQEADMEAFPDAREALRKELLDGERNEAFELYRGMVRKRYEDEGKLTRYEDRIAAMLRQMRAG